MGKNMNISPTTIPGAYVIAAKPLFDERGVFVKVLHAETFAHANLQSDFAESYYSVSKRDVVRGMHFQSPPHAHVKLVYVSRGKIMDVILDIRKGSPTYGQHVVVELSEENRSMVYVPIGCAHGFRALEDDTCVTYLQTSSYAPTSDHGVRADSFGCSWGVTKPIQSQRDKEFPTLAELNTPFNYQSDENV